MSKPKQTTRNRRDEMPDAVKGRNLCARVLREEIWKPVNWENNWRVFVFVGREGSGKSITCASVLRAVDPTFSAERVHFDTDAFLETINSIRGSDRQGTAVMLDESGVGMGVRSWYDEEQIQLNKLMQTARDDNMIVGLTLPRLSELDSQFRGRLHGFCEMWGVQPEEYAIWSWKHVFPSRDEKKELWKKYPRYQSGGRMKRAKRLKIGPPDDSFVKAYKRKKAAFKQEFYESTMGDDEEGDEDDGRGVRDIAAEIKDEGVSPYVNEHGGNKTLYVNWRLIRSDYDLSQNDAKAVKDLLEADDEVNLTL